MARQFKTREALDNYLREQIENAMQATYEELLDKLFEFIEKDVYSNNGGYYNEQSKDMLNRNNWKIRKYKYREIVFALEFTGEEWTEPNYWAGRFYNDETNRYDWDSSGFTHGNIYEPFPNGAEGFLKMLNNERKQGNAFGFPHVDRRPFWDDFVDWAESNYNSIFQRNLKV